GLGALYRKRADHLVDAALTSHTAVDPQTGQWIEKAIQSYQKALDLKPDSEKYGNPVEDVARLALGNTYRLRGVIALLNGDADSASKDFDQAIQLLETSRPIFEALIPRHESYRRYLAQAYEYLGSTYQWQGQAFDTAQQYDQALTAYQKSIEAFDGCIAQGEGSSDLVIQNEIVEKVCKPNLEQTRQTYNELIGGQ
ncbi:MAG: hypothetical protein ACM33V_07655, partial [Chloroflexota bacterium]